MADKHDDHDGGFGQKVLLWIGIAVVALLALRGLSDMSGVQVQSGSGFAGVTWDRPSCSYRCNRDELTPADYEFLHRLYKD